MKKLFAIVVACGCVIGWRVSSQQAWTGTLSDARCGGSHQAAASARGLTDRQCAFDCVKGLAKYVIVDTNGDVIPIANQDAPGLPLYTGRRVRLTGELKSGEIVVSEIVPVEE